MSSSDDVVTRKTGTSDHPAAETGAAAAAARATAGNGAVGTGVSAPPAQETLGANRESLHDRSLYINRELSWLAFNRRVLEEAWDERHPLLERVKFLAIFGSNLDEFFMIRVSGLQVQRAAGVADVAVDGLTPTEALVLIQEQVERLTAEARSCWGHLRTLLARQRIKVCRYDELTHAERDYLARYFDDEVFPILTPLAVDSGHPFPHISNLSLSLAVVIRDPAVGERFARTKVPATLPRLVPVDPPGAEEIAASVGNHPSLRFVWLEEVIAHHAGALFPGLEPVAVYPFRVTRNADIEIQEDEAEDLLRAVEQGIGERQFGFVTRLEVPPGMPENIRNLLVENLEMDRRNVLVVDSEMGKSSLMELTKIDRPDLKFPPYVAKTPGAIKAGQDLFSVLARQDVLLHHPYDSFSPVIQMVEAAAHDPHVRAIKQTLYRLGPNSPLTPALIDARDGDTQVAVLVELKARFDEENNIEWARALERAGVHVVYGLVGLKTHCKVLLIVRREAGGVRRYVHFGTGNYNALTARIYTDFGLMTSDPDLGADASDLFNYLTGYSRQTRFRKILVAPINLRQRIVAMIDREIEHALAERPARLLFQMNALVDPQIIDRLYAASQAGVRVDLIIRGICSLRPGLPNISDNITVISVVGRFLEHSRCFYFENGGDPALYLGSADLMQRNLDRRVEVMFPVEDVTLRDYIVRDVLMTYLNDNVQARRLRPDGEYEEVKPEGRRRRVDAQSVFMRMVRPTGTQRAS